MICNTTKDLRANILNSKMQKQDFIPQSKSGGPPKLTCGKWWKKQEHALKQMTTTGDNILVKWGNFHWTSFSDQDEFTDFIFECKEKERQFYEVLLADKPQRMFADLDGQGLQITKEDMYAQWLDLMQKVFLSCFNSVSFNHKNIKILDSSNSEKISFHWSYTGIHIFKNCDEQKQFWKYVESVIESDYPDLCFTHVREDGKIELRTVLDLAVYSKNRSMRTIYSHKEGSNRVLMPCKWQNTLFKPIKQFNPADYLIYYTGSNLVYFTPNIPTYQNQFSRGKIWKRADVEKIITDAVPNVEITELRGRMFVLKNTATRTCIIGSEENVSDNCYVVWKRDGLYFGCHDVACEGKLKQIYKLDASESEKSKLKNLTIEQLRELAKECDTFKKRQKLINLLIQWMNIKYCLVKSNKTFILEEFEDMDEDDNFTTGIKYKDMKSFEIDFMNKTLTTVLTREEIQKHDDVIPKIGPNTLHPDRIWLQHKNRREVDKIVFDPKMFYDKPKHAPNYYNLFTGFAITKEDVKDTEVPENFEEHAFFHHIRKRLCNGNIDAYNAVVNMFAHILQKPWEKLQMSLVLKSTMRTGKGIVFQIIKDIIANKYFFQPSKPSQVLGDFNGQMKNCLICFMDEMVWGGDKEKAGTIKKLVTENVNYVNEKYAPVIRVKNLSNVFMASNEDWVVPAGATEQRWLVLNVDDELAVCPKPTKKKIVKDILSIDRKRLAKFLYNRDLSNWSHRETVNTDGLRQQKVQSLSAIHRWWLSCLDNRTIPDDEDDTCHSESGNFGSFIDKTQTYKFAQKNFKERHMTDTKFWIEMKKILGKEYKIKRLMKNGTRQYYVNIPSIETCRARWCELYNDENWKWQDDECECD